MEDTTTIYRTRVISKSNKHCLGLSSILNRREEILSNNSVEPPVSDTGSCPESLQIRSERAIGATHAVL
jgi:hypothetical protein